MSRLLTKASIEVNITMSLEDALAVELALRTHAARGDGEREENIAVQGLRLALERQLGRAERALQVVA